MERKELAKGRGTARRVGRRFSERQWPKEADRGIKEWDNISPGDVGSGVGRSSWVEEDTFTKFDVARSGSGEAMP